MILLALLFFKKPVVAAQILTMTLLLHASSDSWLYALFMFPVYLFFLLATIFEVWNFIYYRSRLTMNETWKHLEDLRSKRDMEALVTLMISQKKDISVKTLVQAGIEPATLALHENIQGV